MPPGKPHLPVPTFTRQLIALADLCARELWHGVSYQTGKKLYMGDEEFLVSFANPTKALIQNPASSLHFTEVDIRALIRTATLRALFRSTLSTDFQAGIAAFAPVVLPHYHAFITNQSSADSYKYATDATLDWCQTFVQSSQAKVVNGNYRVPLANRILFFALPHMKIFIYSNGLGKKMQYQTRPQAALPTYNREFDIGYKNNLPRLSNLRLPSAVSMSDSLWTSINQSDWWQRRVFDLALMIHFGATQATQSLQHRARQIIQSPTAVVI